jgi:hypothetical protein
VTIRRFPPPWSDEEPTESADPAPVMSRCDGHGATKLPRHAEVGQARGRKGLRQMTWRYARGLLTAILPVLSLSCVSQPIIPPVWSYYDNCAAQNPSFVAMVKCGRERRLAECEPKNQCSPEGTLFMEYADSLALSVKNKKHSETEAFRLLAEYKTGRPCTVIGNTVNCH